MNAQAHGSGGGREGAGGETQADNNPLAAWLKSLPPGLWMLLLLMAVFSVATDNYFDRNNWRNILVQSVPLMILSFSQTLIVLTQGTDLSLGAQVSLVTVVWVWLANRGVHIYLSAGAAVAAAVGIGALNGLLVSKGRIPPFIATFGTQNVVMSIALLLTSGSSIYHYHPLFESVMETRVAGIVPLPVVVAACSFALTWVLLYRTRFGTNIFGLGGNQEALSLAGVSIAGSYVKTYAYAGFLAGICGLVTTCRVESGQPIVGMGWEFEAVAATLLGGTSLREGHGGVSGTIIGVLLLVVLRNGLNVSGISAMYQNAIIGSIVMLAIVVDALVRRGRD